jgi:hypothetical protein
MKKLLLLAAVTLVCFTGCYKEKEMLKAYVALTDNTWKIQSHTRGIADSGADCRVANELVFNKDSTGFYFYPTRCDSTDIDTLRFNWQVSTDNKNLYYTYIQGDSLFSTVMGLSYYDRTNIRLRGDAHFKRFLDGNFIAKPKK